MLEVGKKYRVIEPEKVSNQGFETEVTILEEEAGIFRGDNDCWYFSDGKQRSEPGMNALETINIDPDSAD